MPKLPSAVTKASAKAASRLGPISGSTTCRSIPKGPAPQTRAASLISRGRVRSAVRTSRNTSGACCTASSAITPSRE